MLSLSMLSLSPTQVPPSSPVVLQLCEFFWNDIHLQLLCFLGKLYRLRSWTRGDGVSHCWQVRQCADGWPDVVWQALSALLRCQTHPTSLAQARPCCLKREKCCVDCEQESHTGPHLLALDTLNTSAANYLPPVQHIHDVHRHHRQAGRRHGCRH